MYAFSVILLSFGSGWLRRKKLFQYAQNFFAKFILGFYPQGITLQWKILKN